VLQKATSHIRLSTGLSVSPHGKVRLPPEELYEKYVLANLFKSVYV